MIALGLLSLLDSSEQEYFTEIAKRAKLYDIVVYRFSPLSIDPNTELVSGEQFHSEKQTWEKAKFPIPRYIYDRCFYKNDERSKKSKPIVQWLKNRPDTEFLGYGLPSKFDIYQVLANDFDLSAYTPATEKVTSAPEVIKSLLKHKQILLKPEFGSQGKGIIVLSLENGQIKLVTQHREHLFTKLFIKPGHFKLWFQKLLEVQPYLLQPFLSLQNEENKPFDIRILLHKNKDGIWAECGRGVRIGQTGNIISNISGGSTICSYDEWKKALTSNQLTLLESDLATILQQIPFLLEQQFGRLFELGIDIGVAKDGSVWILDTNSKPGRKVVAQTSPEKQEDMYRAPLAYTRYLHSLQTEKTGVESHGTSL
jgi:glutathione synthase/RimK-type ligase-like ATP-grasp enzyme